MSVTIHTIAEPFYTLRARLDDKDYSLEFYYRTRDDRYFVNLYDAEENLLVAGLKLVCNVALLRFYHHKDGVPSGELVVTAGTLDASPPKLGELGYGQRCELTYYTQAEIRAGLAAL